jgi:hypothetical protein
MHVRSLIALLGIALCVVQPAWAHGPQIQTTGDTGKIVTRRIVPDGAYDTALSAPTSVYAMPLAEYLNVWRAQPDGSLLPDLTPEFVGWPGFAYGYGYDATTNPAPFPLSSKFILGFTAGLKSWNGVAFVEAGVTEAEIYRGSSAAPSALAKTTDTGPFASVMFPGGAGISFTAEGSDVHNTVNYRMVGDGSSITSPLSDGIYLLSLQLSSTSTSLTASDPFYFVLSKNGSAAGIQAAIGSLGFDPSRVQNLVPEPTTAGLATCAVMGLMLAAHRRRKVTRS